MFQFEKAYKEWSFERVSRHIFYWLLWIVFFTLVHGTYWNTPFSVRIQVECLLLLIKIPFVYFVIFFLLPRYLKNRSWRQFILSISSAAIIGGFTIILLYHYLINPMFYEKSFDSIWSVRIILKSVDLIYVATIPAVFKLIQWQHQKERLSQKAVQEKLSAELQLLKNQLHPHFLFNTLNNLYGMVLTEDKRSPEVVMHLSEMLSYMLYECDSSRINLEKEISCLKHYIELEKVRHGSKLDINVNIAGDFEQHSIAPLIFMPFIENAFKHVGINNKRRWISIYIHLKEKELVLSIENSIKNQGINETVHPPTQRGIGLENVKKRLNLLYPESHSLEMNSGRSYLVNLKLSLESTQKPVLYV